MKIVLVAENGFTRSSVNVNLRTAGHAVIEAEPTCLLDVLIVLRRELPHLVLMDFDIPACECETVVRIIREDPVLFSLPVLLILTSWETEVVGRMKHWRHIGFMNKPLKVEALLQAVQAQAPEFRSLSLGDGAAW